MVRGFVVDGLGHRVRKVLLGGDAVRRVVRVRVALAVADALRARVVRVAQVLGNHARLARAHVGDGAVDRHVGTVGLGRERKVRGRLREHDAALRHADEAHRIRGGLGDDEALRVREANVLRREDHEPRAMNRGSSPATTMRAR